MSNVLGFENASARGRVFNVEEGLSLEGEIVKYSNVSLSPTLDINEKKLSNILLRI